jgi:hypothetical protein
MTEITGSTRVDVIIVAPDSSRDLTISGAIGVIIPMVETYFGRNDKNKFTKKEVMSWVNEPAVKIEEHLIRIRTH